MKKWILALVAFGFLLSSCAMGTKSSVKLKVKVIEQLNMFDAKAGWKTTVAITQDKRILLFGLDHDPAKKSGEKGVAHKGVDITGSFSPKKVVLINEGIVILDDTGRVFIRLRGNEISGKGLGKQKRSWVQIQHSEKVLFLSSYGNQVYAIDSNQNMVGVIPDQQNLQNNSTSFNVLFQFDSWGPENGRIAWFGVSESHAIFALEDGQLFEWEFSKSSKPKKSTIQVDVAQVVVGYNFVLVVKENGEMWAKGDNLRGQLGLTAEITNSSEYLQIPLGGKVKTIGSNRFGNVAQVEGGDLFYWGKNGFLAENHQGIFGEDKTKNVFTPKPMGSFENLKHISCGVDHCVGITTSGHLVGWGANDKCQLGCP